MEKAKFTRGEWKVKNRTNVVAGEKQVASTGFKMGGWPREDFEEEAANARLIAAAPSLLKALKALVSQCPAAPGTHLREVADNARAAIALAEGGAE